MYSDSEPVTSPLMTSDFQMVACSVLFKTALRGAATGVGSLARVGVVFVFVLITGFSGSVIGFGFGLGVVLAGFHIVFTSFQLLFRAMQPAPFAAALYLWIIGTANEWHVHYQTRPHPQFRKLWIWRCLT
jgi:hypothetical protein